jgi:FkbM family methyltransferase
MNEHEIKIFGETNNLSPNNLKTFNFHHQKFKDLIPKNSVVLDIGAHVGGFSLIFGSCTGENGTVLAFEPNPITYKTLIKNSKLNPQFNIIPINCACTLENKKYTFNYSDPKIYGDGTNGGFFDEIDYGDQIKEFHSTLIEVDGVNVTDFLNKNYSNLIDDIKFIKTSTEGFDKEVLKTLTPIINKNKPVLMVEAFRALSKPEILDFYNTLKSFNYEIYDVSPLDNQTDCTGPLTLEEFEHYIYKIVDNGNFFCFHKEEIYKYNLPVTKPNKTAAIIFGRNDNYKEKERFIIHLNTMLDTFDEVIYIDWNSPTNSFLYEVIDKIHHTGRLKHYIIPPEYANMMTMGDKDAQTCNASLAFNIGIRRTDAEWIVLSTTDIIPPTKEVLNEFIQKSNKNSFYTLSRRDIEYKDIIDNLDTLDEYRKYLDKSTTPRYFPAKVTPNDNYSIFNCCGDFQLASKNLWYKIRGYEEMMLYSCFVDTNVQKKAVLYGFDLIPVYDVPLYHMSHQNHLPQGGNTENLHKNGEEKSPKYNDANYWVENFDKYLEHDNIMYSRNADTWGFSNIEIEFEII